MGATDGAAAGATDGVGAMDDGCPGGAGDADGLEDRCAGGAVGDGPGPTGTARGSADRAGGTDAIPMVAPPGPAVAKRTVVRRSGDPAGIRASDARRSAGPPRAGSGRAPVNASSARVLTRRGIASCVTVTFTSGATRGRARTSSTMAAPLTTPRTRPRARKLNSLAVTLSASRGSWPPAIAIPSPGQRSCGIPARQLGRWSHDGRRTPARRERSSSLDDASACVARPAGSVQAEGGRW